MACKFVLVLGLAAMINVPLMMMTQYYSLVVGPPTNDHAVILVPPAAEAVAGQPQQPAAASPDDALSANSTKTKLEFDCKQDSSNTANNGTEKTIVIFPFRNRDTHLKLALSPIHQHLINQNVNYELYVIEQMDDKPFNRAKLFNVGVIEAVLKIEKPKSEACAKHEASSSSTNSTSSSKTHFCLILHDIDLMPLNSTIPYRCSGNPTLLSSGISKFNYKLPYASYFGGAVSIPLTQFIKINGMSNDFWGWGGEDDDFYRRLTENGLKPSHLPSDQGMYKALPHAQEKAAENRVKVLAEGKGKSKLIGLKQCKYKVMEIIKSEVYTHVKVEL